MPNTRPRHWSTPHRVTTVAEEVYRALRRTAPLFTRQQREPFQRALRLGLGTVELTVALRYIYNTPFDQLIWDVGHQAYPHKILTGRRDKIGTIRQKGGLHPFPWRGESEYDVIKRRAFINLHQCRWDRSCCRERRQKSPHRLYVIGDGAITAGMAFEAMNHAGDIRPDMLVVLNDMNVDFENVGALNNHLAQLLSRKLYSSLREAGKRFFLWRATIKELLKRTEEHIKRHGSARRCLKSWALTTSAQWTVTILCWGLSPRLRTCATAEARSSCIS